MNRAKGVPQHEQHLLNSENKKEKKKEYVYQAIAMNSYALALLLPAALPVSLALRYFYRRYCSPIANAPVAPADNFWLKYFGLVPPPDDSEETDRLSEFLIKVGQDPEQTPISVCWSIMGTPLVLVNTLQGIKDVLVDGQRATGKEIPKVQRGDLIRFIQNLVFGGANLNNTVGEVCNTRMW